MIDSFADIFRRTLLMLSGLVASAALAVGVCDDLKLSFSDVEKHLVLNVLPSPEKLAEAELQLKKGRAVRCRDVLSEFLVSVKNRKERTDLMPVRGPLLSLAANGGMEAAVDVLEFEISKGRGDDLFDALERANPARYRKALRSWLESAIEQLTSEKPQKSNEPRLISPLFMERFLKMVAQSDAASLENDFGRLNSVFILAEPGYREVFLPLYGAALKPHAASWIVSFRREPPGRQFRLFPIFEAVGGPDVVSELMKLSREHGDERLRAMAERSLNRILKEPQKK